MVATSIIGVLSAFSNILINVVLQIAKASTRKTIVSKTAKLTKRAYIYNSEGKKIDSIVYQKGKKIITYGTKKIKNKRYYSLGNNKYVPVSKTKVPKPKNQDGDCILSFDKSTKTLHVIAGKDGNKLGKGPLIKAAL